jgi:DNA-binding transcriptional MerR regulator
MTSETADFAVPTKGPSLRHPAEALRFINHNRSDGDARPSAIADHRKLEVIERFRQLGFDLRDCLTLIRLSELGAASDDVAQSATDEEFAHQLAAVDERIIELMRLRGALLRLQARGRRPAGGFATLLVGLDGAPHA